MKNKLWLSLVILTSISLASSAQTVTLDYYFNHEVRTNKAGQKERFHYMWEDTGSTGFSILGKAFTNNGAILKSLDAAPTAANLKNTDVYIIVDPDTKKESPNPNYIEKKDILEIVKWVKSGGILFLLANDSANVELPHFNQLAGKFGLHFNDDLQNHVINDEHFEDGAIEIKNDPIFKTSRKIFMKDVCSISITGVAYAGLKNKDNAVIMAITKYGKGTVVAVGDPWLYNEYTNGRLPSDFENDKAAHDITKWLMEQVPAK